jgi:group I intron endonuclease
MQGIYKITNPIGQVYIGLSCDIEKRFYQHKLSKSNTKLCKSFKFFGIENHNFEILELVSLYKDLLKREMFYIDKYNSKKQGLNSTKGTTPVYYKKPCQEYMDSIYALLD